MELPGCTAHGDTQESALSNVKDTIQLWIDTALEFGDPVPAPKYVDLCCISATDWHQLRGCPPLPSRRPTAFRATSGPSAPVARRRRRR
ncbi:MAG: type II toxin-antitoxin system HicB family antitoxin [Chloroflexi bacterium]|nr:type II toxin-antitoxin system HicB family antitoxin [Chloroflexota bacterium]